MRGQGLAALVAALALAGTACTGAGSNKEVGSAATAEPTFSPAVRARPTLGLHLFRAGEIVRLARGEERVVARWPARSAPYRAPVETPYGFLGLAYGRKGVDLWLVGARQRVRLARDVSYDFALAAGAAKLAYGRPRYHDGTYRTRLVLAVLPQARRLAAIGIDGYAAPVGFIGQRVLIATVSDPVARLLLWDPRSSALARLGRRYRQAFTTEPSARLAVVDAGGDGCWKLVAFADAPQGVGKGSCFRPTAFSPHARWLAALAGGKGAPARVEVFDTYRAERRFRSSPLPEDFSRPGALQIAWEDDHRLLILARAPHATTIYRCRPGEDGRACRALWSAEVEGRDTAWLVPRAPRPRQVRRDRGRGFALWPEHRGIDARRACSAPQPWRTAARSTAEEFGRRVLGWTQARAEIDRYTYEGVHIILQRGDGPLVGVFAAQVARRCWSVIGVARAPDRRPEGVSVRVDGRRVQIGVAPLGATSAEVIVGFNGRALHKVVTGRASASFLLGFQPKGSGSFLVLLRDGLGRTFSAAGGLLYPGLVAG